MKRLILSLMGILLFAGCSRFEESADVSILSAPAGSRSTLAVSDENPYSLSNMQQAYNDVAVELNLSAQTLIATHHYVRFSVLDSVDYDILYDSLGLELFEYPLDRELTDAQMEAYVNDASITEYYTVVPSDFQYPSEVAHEFLDDLYMQPESHPTLSVQIGDEYYDQVVEQSMVNNGIEVEPESRAGTWYPSATIQYVEDRNDTTIPLEGVKVRCSTYTNSGSGTTDASGNVTGVRGWGGRFRNSVKYRLIWENSKWNIRDGRSGQGKTQGPKQRSHWSHTIQTSDVKASFFAAVHRALWGYFYESYPLTSGITKVDVRKMNVGVIWSQNEDRNARFNPATRTLGGNPIVVWTMSGSSSYKDRWEVTGSVFHELGHATHWQAVINKRGANRWDDYHFANDDLTESWARGVQSAYMRSFYSDYLQSYSSNLPNYTAVVESLMYQGLTLKQIETAMVGERIMEYWKQNVMSLMGVANYGIIESIFTDPLTPRRVNYREYAVSCFSAPSTSEVGDAETLSVPSYLDHGVVFSHYSISGGNYDAPNGLGNRNTTVIFRDPARYTVTAGFNLGNPWHSYSVSSQIDVVDITPPPPPPPPSTPSISSELIEEGGGSPDVYVVFSVDTPQTGVTYQWDQRDDQKHDHALHRVHVPFQGRSAERPLAHQPDDQVPGVVPAGRLLVVEQLRLHVCREPHARELSALTPPRPVNRNS